LYPRRAICRHRSNEEATQLKLYTLLANPTAPARRITLTIDRATPA